MDFTLHNKIERRIKWLKNDGIKYVSGTVSPAPSDHDTDNIESLEKAFEYFTEHNVDFLHIQPKWMGSRCQLYLFRDEPEKNFAVSRNGYKIKNVDLSAVYAEWSKIFEGVEAEGEERAVSVILDGELLPWRAIGMGLIDREFEALTMCVSSEVEFLEKNGMSAARNMVAESTDYLSYLSDLEAGMGKKELLKKYPRFGTYELFDSVERYNTEEEKADLAKYEEQLNLYSTDGAIEFKGFDILRIDYADGTFNVDTGWMENAFLKYIFVNRFNDNELECTGEVVDTSEIDKVRDYMQQLVANGYEGIMIKPIRPADTTAVHCMKVRNPEYLRLIYGYDYQRTEKLTTLVKKKRVGKKRKLSHHEYKLGSEMLKLDWNAIDFDSKYDTIAKNLLFEIEEEATVDSRL